MDAAEIQRLIELDRRHVWHPFTPMRQWREREPIIIERAEGDELIDVHGRRYIDGVSSLWCNVHGHRAAAIDRAIREQLDRVAHTTMLGLCNVPATELAGRLCAIAPAGLNKVFYSDAGATAVEVALKMAVGYWHHRGQPGRRRFIALGGAYHGDTTGSMSVGYSDLFHRPFRSMVFEARWVASPDVFHWPDGPPAGEGRWALESEARREHVRTASLAQLEEVLREEGESIAAIVIEPLVQGAAGLIVHPPGYLAGVEALARRHGVLLIADEVAVGFGRTGRMFACEHEQVRPDILCLGKGLSGGYLPLAATLCTDEIDDAFTGELHEHRTLYHGHTYTGNPLACAAAIASLDLFETTRLIDEVNRKAARLAAKLEALRDRERFPTVVDVRQRGLMVGIELAPPTGETGIGFDPSRRLGHEACDACRPRGLIVRPLGNVVVLMPPLAIGDGNLERMADIVLEVLRRPQG